MQIVSKGLKYSYEKKSRFCHDALKGIDLEILEGDFFAIIGKTGSGKSTFVQHLNALIKVQKDSGSLTVGEFDLTAKKIDYKSLRSKIGMVFQYPEYQLFAETVASDVGFALENFCPEKSKEEKEKLVRSAINAVGLNYDEIKDKSPFELSGGQKRRVAIAGAIAPEPEVLVLDEPVAGLDPKGKEDFFELLHRLHTRFVKTIVIITHDMDIVTEHATRCAVMNDGKVVLTGTPKQVFSNEEEIKKAGLELPLTAYLQNELKKTGVIIDSDLTVKDFTEKLLALKGVEI
jgi:energy-coupling factor transport system ATP-binding protein